MTNKAYLALRNKVRVSRMSSRFNNCSPVAIVCGPCVVVETIVKEASVSSGIPMDWHYVGGRGVVYALGDREEAREALSQCLPYTDLKGL